MKKIFLGCVLSILGLAHSQAANVTVCASGANYTTINAAINAANNNDDIVICDGTYNESVSVTKRNLTIRSASGNRANVIVTNAGDNVFKLNERNTTIKNLTLNATGSSNAIVNDYNNGIGSHTFENLVINSQGVGIYLQTGGPHTFKTLNIKSTGSSGGGINVLFNANAAHIYDGVTVDSVGDGIVSNRGAASMRNINVTSSNGIGISLSTQFATVFDTIKVSARNDAIVTTTQDSSSSLTFTSLDLASSAANGINLQRGIASITSAKVMAATTGMVLYGTSLLKTIDVTAQGIGIDIGNQSNTTLNNVIARSSTNTAIYFRDSGGSEYTYTLQNVTVSGAGSSGDGIYVQKSGTVNAENVCVQAAGRYGVYFDYNARKVTLKSAILKGHTNYGVLVSSNPDSVSKVNNSCFYKTPCADAGWPQTARDFSGNYIAAASCSSTTYAQFTNNLGSCPVTESNCYTGSAPVVVTPGAFNAFESSTASTAVTGVIKTKVAGTAFTLHAIAISNNAVQTGFTGDVKVELLSATSIDTTLDANNCPNSSSLLSTQTLTFVTADSGRKEVTFPVVPNVYRNVRVRLSYPASGAASVVSCSTNNFAIRPAQFVVSARDENWSTAGTTRVLNNTAASGGNVHKAGRPFTVSVTAQNSSGELASNYAGTPTADVVCVLPASGCVGGTLTLPSWTGSGTVSTSSATYSEVGAFNMNVTDKTFASVDANDSTEAEYAVPIATISVGRFVPDYFQLVASSTPQFRTFGACSATRSFNYIGQNFNYLTVPALVVTAKNSDGVTTQNYSGNLWNLVSSSFTPTYSFAPSNGQAPAAGITVTPSTSSKGTGTVSLASNTDNFVFVRDLATPQIAFNANVSLSVSVKETVTGTGTGTGDIVSTTPLVFNGSGSGIAFDSGNVFRYGRLRLENVNGSELLDARVPMRVEYWNGTAFVANTDDNCTVVNPSNVQLRAYSGGVNASNLGSANVAGGGQFVQGVGSLILRKPSPAPGTKGSVDLCIDLGPDISPPTGIACVATTAAQLWLQGRWSQTNYDDDPSARASFGTYKSGPVIYMREAY